MKQPRLSKPQIWNLSIGFFGIQFGFALQNANASRILQTFGADVEHLSWFWLVAPFTGLIVQPLIGHYSDRTWNKLGRRKPYFLTGAILATVALMLMPILPSATFLTTVIPAMFIGAGVLMVMDASFNVAMEPFRALVADMLPDEQRTEGFSVQTFLIGAGAILGSLLPYALKTYFGVSGEAPEGAVSDNVIYSFVIGAVALFVAIMWTIVTTKEYPPEEFAQYHATEEEEEDAGIMQIFKDMANMPTKMKQLGLVQFFSWFALFSMWVFTTVAVAVHIYGVDVNLLGEINSLPADDPNKIAFNEAGDWVGVIFAVYNGVSALYALALPTIARATSRKTAHMISLLAGGIGLISMYFISDPDYLILSMIGVGMAWASILAMPYAMLANAIPNGKMGIYMGIFNFFIVIPQIVNGIIGGPIVKYFYDSNAIYAIVMAGVLMIVAAFTTTLVKDDDAGEVDMAVGGSGH